MIGSRFQKFAGRIKIQVFFSFRIPYRELQSRLQLRTDGADARKQSIFSLKVLKNSMLLSWEPHRDRT